MSPASLAAGQPWPALVPVERPLSAGQAAARLGVSEATVYRYRQRGLLPALRDDAGSLWFREADVDAVERPRRSGGRPPSAASAADLGEAVVEHLGWLRLREMSQRTADQRLIALRLLARYIAPRTLLEATANDLKRWQQSTAATLAPRSRAAYGSHVAGFYRWAAREEYVDADPSSVLVRPQLSKLRPRPMPERDLEFALRSVPAEVRLWVLLAALCGLRASEVAGLHREHVLDSEAKPLLVLHGKGNKVRVVPLHPRALAALREWGMPDTGPLFVRDDGTQVTGRWLSNTVNRHLHSAGIVATLHQCRHRYATRLYAESRDLLLVRDMLGHEAVASTEIYAEADKAVSAYDWVAAL